MAASITLAGESLIAQKQAASQPLKITNFVLANVPGLNPNGPVNRAAGKPLGVCGESAGDPLLALVLAGLGAGSLSMAPGKVPAVRLALATHTLDDCERLAALALAAETSEQARDAVRAAVDPELAELL